jgi:hypothetical protein
MIASTEYEWYLHDLAKSGDCPYYSRHGGSISDEDERSKYESGEPELDRDLYDDRYSEDYYDDDKYDNLPPELKAWWENDASGIADRIDEMIASDYEKESEFIRIKQAVYAEYEAYAWLGVLFRDEEF